MTTTRASKATETIAETKEATTAFPETTTPAPAARAAATVDPVTTSPPAGTEAATTARPETRAAAMTINLQAGTEAATTHLLAIRAADLVDPMITHHLVARAEVTEEAMIISPQGDLVTLGRDSREVLRARPNRLERAS